MNIRVNIMRKTQLLKYYMIVVVLVLPCILVGQLEGVSFTQEGESPGAVPPHFP
jgi:hypothetical protein